MSEEEMTPSTVEVLARLSFVITARLEASATGMALSMQQVRLLGILRDHEPTINELAAHLGVDKSSMSGAVVRAEKRGLVIRLPDGQDGRSVRVRLMPAGRTLVEAASAEFEADAERILASLTDGERAQWTALTSRLLSAAVNPASGGRSVHVGRIAPHGR